MDLMKKVDGSRLLLYVVVIVAAGALSLQNADSIGRTLASAMLPADEAPESPASPETQAVAEEAATPAVILYSKDQLHFKKLTPLRPEMIDTETLWLARCIYSETKREREQELIAWVVRNRVETQYRGKGSYRDVVLDPYQFSAFNPNGRTRQFYAGLGPNSRYPGWQKALRIAYEVRNAEVTYRPFSRKTRHFYSEQSMVGPLRPDWASGLRPVLPERDYHIEPRRFRFYEGVF